MNALVDIPFATFSDETKNRLVRLIDRKAPTARARTFLSLCLDAVDSNPPQGLAVDYNSDALLVTCDRERLAELLGCSAKTIQRGLAQGGEFYQFCESIDQVVTADNGLRSVECVLVIYLEALRRMPDWEPRNAREALLHRYGHGLGDLKSRFLADRFSEPAAVPATEGCGDVRNNVHPMSSGMSTRCPVHVHRVSSPCPVACPPDVQSLMNHDHEIMNHERMNERRSGIFEMQEKTETHPEQEFAKPEQQPDGTDLRFCAIQTRHLFAIAGHDVPCNDGGLKKAGHKQRLRLLDGYLDDAIQHGRADPSDRLELLALFHCAANRPGVSARAKWLFAVWSKHKLTSGSMLEAVTVADRRYASELVELASSATG